VKPRPAEIPDLPAIEYPARTPESVKSRPAEIPDLPAIE
jgi:hypothetical protein